MYPTSLSLSLSISLSLSPSLCCRDTTTSTTRTKQNENDEKIKKRGKKIGRKRGKNSANGNRNGNRKQKNRRGRERKRRIVLRGVGGERENSRLVLNVRERDGKSTWSPRGARGCAREAADERETSGDTFMNCPIHGMRILARQTLGVNGSGTVR